MKKIPTRMCVVCRRVAPKNELIRVVRNSDGDIFIDESKKAAGRGAYICDSIECIEKCVAKKMLNKAFSSEIEKEIYEKLKGEYLAKKQS